MKTRSELRSRMRGALPLLVAGLGLLCGAISVLDPFRPRGAVMGLVLVAAALLVAVIRKRRVTGYVVALVLAFAYLASSRTLIEFRADSASYYAYLRSVAFDRDLNFRNEWDTLRPGERPPGFVPRKFNVFAAGPAVVWSPFFLLSHLYVRCDHLFGRDLFALDGFSLPYLRSTALGTVTIVVLGASALVLMLARRRGFGVAFWAVVGTVLASPVLYYTFFVPAMSHGVTFGIAALFLAFWDRTRREPSLASWTLLGGTLGLLAACRWQASLYGMLAAALALRELFGKRLRVSFILAATAAGLVGFGPQMLAWKIGFGEWLVIPQGRGFLDFSSPHWLDTLISADHGLFNWTPLMVLGLVGLVAGLRDDFLLHGPGLAIFALTAWVNGSVPAHDWAAGDAFGARRYCVVVPLLAVGLAFVLELSCRALRRAPLLAPALVILFLSAWNLGLVSQFRARKYPGPAPLERVAEDQARALHRATERALGALSGSKGRALAYEMFSAEYFYRGLNPSGTIYLRSADERYLLEGWYTPSRRVARRTFRRALYPEACVKIPLEQPFELRVSVSARAPDGLDGQSLALAVNGRNLGVRTIDLEWRELYFVVPRDDLLPGENVFCLRFANGLPEEDDVSVAALVEKNQLP